MLIADFQRTLSSNFNEDQELENTYYLDILKLNLDKLSYHGSSINPVKLKNLLEARFPSIQNKLLDRLIRVFNRENFNSIYIFKNNVYFKFMAKDSSDPQGYKVIAPRGLIKFASINVDALLEDNIIMFKEDADKVDKEILFSNSKYLLLSGSEYFNQQFKMLLETNNDYDYLAMMAELEEIKYFKDAIGYIANKEDFLNTYSPQKRKMAERYFEQRNAHYQTRIEFLRELYGARQLLVSYFRSFIVKSNCNSISEVKFSQPKSCIFFNIIEKIDNHPIIGYLKEFMFKRKQKTIYYKTLNLMVSVLLAKGVKTEDLVNVQDSFHSLDAKKFNSNVFGEVVNGLAKAFNTTLDDVIPSFFEMLYRGRVNSFGKPKVVSIDGVGLESNSEKLNLVQYGHSCGKGKNQVRVLTIFDHEYNLPLYSKVYKGNITDVSICKQAFTRLSLSDLEEVLVVGDRGCSSLDTISAAVGNKVKTLFMSKMTKSIKEVLYNNWHKLTEFYGDYYHEDSYNYSDIICFTKEITAVEYGLKDYVDHINPSFNAEVDKNEKIYLTFLSPINNQGIKKRVQILNKLKKVCNGTLSPAKLNKKELSLLEKIDGKYSIKDEALAHLIMVEHTQALVTNHEINDPCEAIEFYRLRPLIEVLHKGIQSGSNLKSLGVSKEDNMYGRILMLMFSYFVGKLLDKDIEAHVKRYEDTSMKLRITSRNELIRLSKKFNHVVKNQGKLNIFIGNTLSADEKEILKVFYPEATEAELYSKIEQCTEDYLNLKL